MVDPREKGGGRERLEFQERTKIPGFKRWGPVKDRLDIGTRITSLASWNMHAFCQCLWVCPALWLYNFIPASALRVVIRPTQKLI